MGMAICRVVGNELPPRDQPGRKLAALEYILANERHVERVWVLNHLHDAEYRQRVLNLLVNARETFQELRFDPRHYSTLSSTDERIRYAINVNQARNLAIELTRPEHDFAVSLDQDCFLTPSLWAWAVRFIRDDQITHPERRYYGLMMKRLHDGDPRSASDLPNEEPQIVFRRDAPVLFDPMLMFGADDKMKLLQRLGYGGPPNYPLAGDTCRTAGYVLHLPSGPIVAERRLHDRLRLRRASLARLLNRLDTQCASAWPPDTLGSDNSTPAES